MITNEKFLDKLQVGLSQSELLVAWLERPLEEWGGLMERLEPWTSTWVMASASVCCASWREEKLIRVLLETAESWWSGYLTVRVLFTFIFCNGDVWIRFPVLGIVC